MLRSPFFRRLFLTYVGLIAAATTGIGLYAASVLRESYLEGEVESLRAQAAVMDALLAPRWTPEPSPELDAILKPLASRNGCRITVVAESGKVVSETMADAGAMGDHRLRPEIVAASANGEGSAIRRSDTVEQAMLYFARRSEGPGGTTYFLRLAVPIERLDGHLASLYWGLAAAGLAALLLGGGLSWRAARTRARAVGELTAVAEAVSGGDLGRRASVRETGEIGALGTALDAMAESLGTLVGQLEREKAELTTVLAAMSEGVIAVDREQRILACNRAARDLLDFHADPPEGRVLWEALREDALLAAADDALRTGERKDLALGRVRGRHLRACVCAMPGAGGPAGAVLVVHDATEAARFEDLRKEFVANVSHELRTPLTVIKGFVETLRDGAARDPAKGAEYLATIDKHVRQMTALVEDLLALSALESRPGLPARTPIDAADLVRRVVDLQRPVAERKRQTLAIDAPERMSPFAGDPAGLERAVSNLVGNAIKYTGVGGTIRVSTADEDGAVRIEVSDTGIGIPEADLPRIFERFYRVDKSRSREMGGTGLGLAIVKHVVQAHGGTVEVRSKLGEGSTFRVVLPLGVARPPADVA